jgi:hypothetical protein
MQDYCQKNYPLNAATRQEAEQKAAEAAQRSMQEELSQFIDSCKPFMKDSKDVREAVKKAEAMLKDSGGKYIPQAKRTLSGRSRQQSGRGRQS